MNEKFNVTTSPHVRAKDDTQRIMLYVIIALLPATGFGIYNFGWKSAMLIAITVASCVGSEWAWNKLLHKKNTVKDLSAVVTGLLLALNFPSSIPWWMAILGGVFAIIVVKMFFGGLGQNVMNPALGARCFLVISFAGYMTDFSDYEGYADVFGGATPLATLKAGGQVDLLRMMIGTTPGTIGETSMIAIVVGAMFLIIMGVIDIRIPGTYIVTLVIFVTLFGGRGIDPDYIVAHLAGGGLMIGAFFMATDYVTSPITPTGKIVYGIILGVLTGIFRIFGSSAEGVSYAIIFTNLLVPLIERWTVPRAFGVVRTKEVKANEGK